MRYKCTALCKSKGGIFQFVWLMNDFSLIYSKFFQSDERCRLKRQSEQGGFGSSNPDEKSEGRINKKSRLTHELIQQYGGEIGISQKFVGSAETYDPMSVAALSGRANRDGVGSSNPDENSEG